MAMFLLSGRDISYNEMKIVEGELLLENDAMTGV